MKRTGITAASALAGDFCHAVWLGLLHPGELGRPDLIRVCRACLRHTLSCMTL